MNLKKFNQIVENISQKENLIKSSETSAHFEKRIDDINWEVIKIYQKISWIENKLKFIYLINDNIIYIYDEENKQFLKKENDLFNQISFFTGKIYK